MNLLRGIYAYGFKKPSTIQQLAIVPIMKKLDIIGEDEESMLDQAFDVKENSRLGCQIEFDEDLNGIIVELAPD